MTNPGYVVLVLAHALCGLIGFGALATTGAYAEAVRRHADPFSSASLRRFFKPGHNLASATILAVPFLGGGLLLAQHGKDVHLLYPWLGLGLWSFAVTTALVVVWPAEKRLQRLLTADEGATRGVGDRASTQLKAIARRCGAGATLTTICFVVALIVMIGQP